MRRSRWSLALFAGALTVATGMTWTAGAAPVQDTSPERVLVISLPGVSWADVADEDLPALERFFEEAALADLAPRGVSPRSGPGDAYLTISAGARAATERSVDGQVLALDEHSGGSAAGEIFTRRTGLVPDGRFVALAWPELVRRNAREPYDAELGLLTTTLHDAKIDTAVIGNADGSDVVGAAYARQVGLALSDTAGVVADGELEEHLTAADPSRPFGVRTDPDAVLAALESHWTGGSDRLVAVVELSDLARTMRYRPMVSADRYAELWSQALTEADELVGLLLEQVDVEREAVLVVAPYNLPGDRDLTLAALRGPGVEQGYLRSASTQRAGFLTLVDVAPTILSQVDVARPVEMEGRPAEVASSEASLDARIDHLTSLNAASRFRERLLVPTTTAVVVALAALGAATVALHASGQATRWHGPLRFGLLTVLAVLPLSYLARGFALEERGIGFYWFLVVVGAMAVASIATVVGRASGRRHAPLAVVLALVVAVPAGDVITGSRLSLSAAFGYSPTGNSRLYGISNYAYGMLAVAAFVLAAFVVGDGRSTRRRGLAVGFLLAILLVLGVPRWGADVGGVLAFTPAIGVFVSVVWGWRIRLRTIVIAGVATAGAVVAFGLLDLARPPEERAHLGRLFERVGDEGLAPLLSIAERKLLANLQVSTSSLWVAVIPLTVAVWVYLVRGLGRPIQRLQRSVPALRAALLASVVAAVLGSLVNDSGAIVGGVAAFVLAASLLLLLLDVDRMRGDGQAPG